MDVDSDNIFPRTKIGRDHQMRDMYRHGKVIDRKHDEKRGPLVRVQYLDRQGLISQWLPVKQFGSRSTAHYYCPKIGDDVNVNMPPNGNENGFVDGSFFNEGNPPPPVDLDTRHYLTEDGTVIEYREKDSTFNMQSAGLVNVEATEMIVLTAPVLVINANIQHTGLMTTTGVHTDANGIHMGAMAARAADLEVRVRQLEERLAVLEGRMA